MMPRHSQQRSGAGTSSRLDEALRGVTANSWRSNAQRQERVAASGATGVRDNSDGMNWMGSAVAQQVGSTTTESAETTNTASSTNATDPIVTLISTGDIDAALQRVEAEVNGRYGEGTLQRERRSELFATLVVLRHLQASTQAKAGGQLRRASREAQHAQTLLARSPMIGGALRETLTAQAQTLGARGTTTQRRTDVQPAGPDQQQPSARAGYDPALGQALARASVRRNGGNRRSMSRCYEYVADAVDVVMGRFLWGRHAYMAAAQLASRKDLFTETSASGLSSLPAGAIVVWGKGNSDSGHISIALGDGRESSDFIRSQMTSHYGGAGARVFLPKGRM